MKKLKLTKKAIKGSFDTIIKISYCAGQYLLNYESEFAYSAGSIGWNCDYYNIDGVIISTGYAPLDNKNANTSYDIIKDFDNKARTIITNYNLNYAVQKMQVQELLREFVKVCTAKI